MSDNVFISFIPLIKQGKTVRVTPQGVSMVPFIMGGRDFVELHSATGRIQRGDIILYRRADGMLVLHRVYRVEGNTYYMLGDGQTQIEGPIFGEQIVARCDVYYKKGIRKDNNSALMKFKYRLWFALRPFRMPIIKANSKVKSFFRTKNS